LDVLPPQLTRFIEPRLQFLGHGCASFVKMLKYEEVYRNKFRDFPGARTNIREFPERIYNQKRLHSALGYLPPAEFENGAHNDAISQLASQVGRFCLGDPGI
jgi:Integrase core domain